MAWIVIQSKGRSAVRADRRLSIRSNLTRLLDHLIRSREHIRWNRQTDLLGSFQIDDQLELRRLLDGNVAWLGAGNLEISYDAL
jgi:hypothetical protein